MYSEFTSAVWEYYHDHQRDLPWRHVDSRGLIDPYAVMVSEVMLQQTQVARVVEKYTEFLALFPDIEALAQASLQDVLKVWQGLGYNRRGRYVREAAKQVAERSGGVMPGSVEELVKLPGIGKNTASAIMVYAHNVPIAFIETNIRTVYLHHFFADQEQVTDTEILEIVEQTVDVDNPREWYWALMDYGVHIKKQHGNANVRSRHYVKQSAFKGSKRQIRGQVLRALTTQNLTHEQLSEILTDPRLMVVLNDLAVEGLITKTEDGYEIAP